MSDDTSQVLGRYGTGNPQSDLIEVRLLNFPLQLFAQAREHHDDVMREFAILALAPPTEGDSRATSARLRELIDVLGRQYGAAGNRTDAERDAAVASGEVTMDLTYSLPATAAEPIRTLHELMDAADEFCRSEDLLTLATTPLQREFREWFLAEFTRQLLGESPRPWSGPMIDDTC